MKFDLEERLIEFAVTILTVSEGLPDTRACNHLNGQLIRSGTAPALNYAEARGLSRVTILFTRRLWCLKNSVKLGFASE
jgi:hypothetical protein